MLFDIGHIALAFCTMVITIEHFLYRKHSAKKEIDLIKGILAKDAREYAESQNTSQERIKEMKTESTLAEKAWKLEKIARKNENLGGIPVS